MIVRIDCSFFQLRKFMAPLGKFLSRCYRASEPTQTNIEAHTPKQRP